MAKYITRTIETYNTKVTFVMNGQLNDYVLVGLIGKKEAKKKLVEMFNAKDITVVSCDKEVASSELYRMLESDFIAYAEVVNKDMNGFTEMPS